MQKKDSDILVSVSLITYNHKNYIRRAIDSILMQEVDFNYEVIIGDDFSSDGTQEILIEYQQKYPERIYLILHPRDYDNIPGRINNTTNLYACRGKYIAMLDGDDFWITKDKLKKQVAFLEQNQEYSICFHNAIVFSEESQFDEYKQDEKHPILKKRSSFNQTDIASGFSFVPASSIIFRNNSFKEFPEWFWNVYSADYALLLILTGMGKAKYLENIYSAYRKNQNSFTIINKSRNDELKKQINQLKILEDNFKGLSFAKRKALIFYLHSSKFFKNKLYVKMLNSMFKSLKNDPSKIWLYLNFLKKGN